MTDIRTKIETAAKMIAAINPENTAVKAARSWWKTGSVYSNHDLDVLHALVREVDAARARLI